MDGEITARTKILGELKAVRSKVQDKLLETRAKGIQGVGTKERWLARAGQRALDARAEAERWQAKAAKEDSRTRRVFSEEEKHLDRVRTAMGARVSNAQTHGADRVDLSHTLVEETSLNFDQIRQRHADQTTATAEHKERSAQLRFNASHTAQRQAVAEIRDAVTQSTRSQVASVQSVKKSLDEGSSKVANAQFALMDRHAECRDFLERQNTCSAQARKIACTFQEQEEAEKLMALARLETKLNQTNSLAHQKALNFEEEATIAIDRNEVWESAGLQTVSMAHARCDGETTKASMRFDEAKRALATMQGHSAAYIRSVVEQWEEAKRADAAKVEAAEARTQALKMYCDETMQQCQDLWADRLAKTEKHVDAKKLQLQEKVDGIDNLAKDRVKMMSRQAEEWRQQAQALLSELHANVEVVRARCAERVLEESQAADEKLRQARERYEQRAKLATSRTSEAEARRDAARAEYAAVMARACGATVEARRRGLDNIADIIEPQEVVNVQSWLEPVDEPYSAGPDPALAPHDPRDDHQLPTAAVDIDDVQLSQAATKIQAIQRGKSARREVEMKKAAVIYPEEKSDFNQTTGSTALPGSTMRGADSRGPGLDESQDVALESTAAAELDA
jgi:hypothetical protein